MLKLTKTGIGLLTRQYRAVLRKCFLINIGVWTLGTAAMGINIASTINACAASSEEVLSLLQSSPSATTGITWSNSTTAAVSDFVFNSSTRQGSGTIAVNTDDGVKYYTYNYTSPYNLTSNEIANNNNSNVTYYNNKHSTINSGTVTFSNNITVNLNADFVQNYVTSPSSGQYADAQAVSALYIQNNNNSTPVKLSNVSGNFIDNHTIGTGAWGGALKYSANVSGAGTIKGNFIENYSESTNNSSGGGAIYVYTYYSVPSLTSIIGNFINNHVKSSTNWGGGGAIYYAGNSISAISGNFMGNYAETIAESKRGLGGAIRIYQRKNNTTTTLRDSSFLDNYAKAVSNGNAGGGAIFLSTINDDTYTYHFDINAQEKNVIFSNNRIIDNGGTTYNDIMVAKSVVLGLNAASGKSISFNGTISNDTTDNTTLGTPTLNINQNSTYHGGTYNFNSPIQNMNVTLGSSTQTEAFTLNLGKKLQSNGTTTTYGSFQNVALTNYSDGLILNTQNDNIDNSTLTSLNLQNSVYAAIDASLSNLNADKFTVDATPTGTGKIKINAIKLKDVDTNNLQSVHLEYYDVQLADENTKDKYEISDALVNGEGLTGVDAGVESVQYDASTGKLRFITSSGSSGGSSIQSIIIGSGAVTPDASSGELTPDENKAITLGAAAARGVTTSVTTNSADLITSGGVKNFLDTNYSRKLTKTDDFCDGLDERFTADFERKIKADLEDKINESPLDLVQIVKGSTDSKASAQSASIVGVRIGGTLDGLYDNLIKKAEDPLTHSPFGSARDDNITFAAANDNTNYKQGGTMNNEANTFSETTENVPASEMHKIRQSRGISSFFRRNNEDMMEKISQSAANTQKINITTIRAA